MSIAQPSAPRLLFRELAEHDLGHFHDLVCDEHIRRFLLDGQNMPLEWCAEILESTSAEKARSGLGLWLLYERARATPFGFAGFLRFEGPESPLQLLYALRASHTGRGYAREAAVALIDFAREHCAQGDIVASVDEPNVASSAVLERLGFQCTGSVPGAFGRMRQYCLPRGRSPDRTLHATSDNWTAVGVVAEGQRVDVDGLDLWSLEWVRTNEPDVLLPHPVHQQHHRFSIYEIRQRDTAIRFAVAEVSPNVYAFYVPKASRTSSR